MLPFAAACGFLVAAASSSGGPGGWHVGEAYGVLVERGKLGTPRATRDLVFFHAIRSTHNPPELLVLTASAVDGNTSGAYRLEFPEGHRQLSVAEPIAIRFDSGQIAFGVKPDGPPLKVEGGSALDGFHLVSLPLSGGNAWLPYWSPAMNGTEPRDGASGSWIELGKKNPVVRPLRQSVRFDEKGALSIDIRSTDDGAPLVGSARFEPAYPLPVWGEILDAARGEHIRFRLAFRCDNLPYALALGRGPVAGDPLLYPPELLANAESAWPTGVRDLVAEELLATLLVERRLRRLPARSSPALGEVVPFSYELFVVNPAVATGERTPPPTVPASKPAASPRGAVALVFAGRFEVPDTRVRYEAWMIPGSDERARESDPPNPVAESTGRLILRWVLGRAAIGLLPGSGIAFYRGSGSFERAMRRAPRVAPAGGVATTRGSDALLLRRESDLAPVEIVFYRLTDDLRTPVVFARINLEGTGSVSAVRRSLLERPKDFFLAGGFTAFSSHKGPSLLLTRGEEEGTTIDRVADRGCEIELLSQVEFPPEPWKLAFEPRGQRSSLWGTSIPFVTGRSRFGDATVPRDAILRRTEGDEMLAYEYWEPGSSWWSAGLTIYPRQGFGVRFRPLVHSRPEMGEGELIPFDPPPPPPQPQGNPTTPKLKPPKEKPKPKDEPPKPPPPVTTGPKTGSGG